MILNLLVIYNVGPLVHSIGSTGIECTSATNIGTPAVKDIYNFNVDCYVWIAMCVNIPCKCRETRSTTKFHLVLL